MNYLELTQQLTQVSHRSDLQSQMYNFVQSATEKLNRRLNLSLVPLVADTDTNEILTDWPLLYLYASLAALYQYIEEGDNMSTYLQLWDGEVNQQNITAPGTEPLVMVGV